MKSAVTAALAHLFFCGYTGFIMDFLLRPVRHIYVFCAYLRCVVRTAGQRLTPVLSLVFALFCAPCHSIAGPQGSKNCVYDAPESAWLFEFSRAKDGGRALGERCLRALQAMTFLETHFDYYLGRRDAPQTRYRGNFLWLERTEKGGATLKILQTKRDKHKAIIITNGKLYQYSARKGKKGITTSQSSVKGVPLAFMLGSVKTSALDHVEILQTKRQGRQVALLLRGREKGAVPLWMVFCLGKKEGDPIALRGWIIVQKNMEMSLCFYRTHTSAKDGVRMDPLNTPVFLQASPDPHKKPHDFVGALPFSLRTPKKSS